MCRTEPMVTVFNVDRDTVAARFLSVVLLMVALFVWARARVTTSLDPLPPEFVVGVVSAVVTSAIVSVIANPGFRLILLAFGAGETLLASILKFFGFVLAVRLVPQPLRRVLSLVSDSIWYITRLVLGAFLIVVLAVIVAAVGLSVGYGITTLLDLQGGLSMRDILRNTMVWSAMLTILIIDMSDLTIRLRDDL